MLEDRVLHLEGRSAVASRGTSAAQDTAVGGPGGRELPVVRLAAESAPTPTAPGSEQTLSARTWHSATASEATHPDLSQPVGPMRNSRSLGTAPSPIATDATDDVGGFAGAAEGTAVAANDGRSFRLVGSRLAELSKTERKPVDAAPAATKPARTKSRAPKARGNKAIVGRYNAAMAMLKAGDAGAAETAFAQFVDAHPRHDYADNALYWRGEAAYDQRHYADALASFTQVVERYGGGNKAPDALLKIGLCYHNLGDPANARDVLTELIGAYPGAPASGIARVKLAELPAASSQGS